MTPGGGLHSGGMVKKNSDEVTKARYLKLHLVRLRENQEFFVCFFFSFFSMQQDPAFHLDD